MHTKSRVNRNNCPCRAPESVGAVVDKQNAGDKLYKPMAGNFGTSAACKAVCELVSRGMEQPSGYTEPLLPAWRLKVKAA